jgi:PAS domain S-box-containing protein
MQSLNEELETSKEELQSTNEELVIVNQEMLDKQEQLNVSLALQLEAYKRVEESEKEQKKLASLLKLATDSANVGIGSLNVKTEKLEWNGLMKKMWGYDEHFDKLTLEDWVKSILPEDKALAFQKIEESKNNRSIYDAEYRIKRGNDGTIAWMKSIGQHQYDDFGEAITLTGINLDITEQKEASEKLKATVIELATKNKQIEESETFNRTILESSPDCLNVLDGEGRIQFMNLSGLCQMEIDDFSAVKNKYWWTLWGSENEVFVKASVDKASKGDTVNFTAICPTAKGTAKWWNVIVSPVVKPGEPVRQIISVSRDITQQKEAEEKIRQSEQLFKSIFDNSLAAIVVTDDQGNYLSANEAASELLEYTVNELLQMNVGDLKTHAKNGAAERFEQYMDKGEEAGEFDFTTKNGDHKFVQYQAIRLKADFHLSIMMDITKQKSFSDELERKVIERTKEVAKGTQQVKEVNQSLELKNRELENANAELNSFTYIASHDLQEPLRKIQAFSKIIIEENVFSDKTHDYFNRIVSAAQRMQNLIVALLDFSRAAEGGFVMVPCDLNKIVADLKSELALGISEKETIIEWEDLPTVNGLPVQLSQLFANLFGNAIKYSRPEVIPHIKITAERIDGNAIAHPAANKQQAYYAIRIADNGIGFEKEYATKIFELFQRLHGRNEYSGTGIGLAIVKKIATNHTGFIVAEGKPNVGSTFILYLPTQ